MGDGDLSSSSVGLNGRQKARVLFHLQRKKNGGGEKQSWYVGKEGGSTSKEVLVGASCSTLVTALEKRALGKRGFMLPLRCYSH